jgi:alpha-beta hydrolase superfamily lysophospholipase
MTVLKWIWRLMRWGLCTIGVLALAAGLLLAVPLSQPPELASIRAGALAIDRTGLPEASRFYARDGSELAYRFYPAADGGTQKIAILIHGSGGGSAGMNQIAKEFAAKGFIVIAPDIRGHGGSGTRGDIGYFGQLDDDLEDLITQLRQQFPGAHFGLLGFSSGGGFALRLASGKLASNFDRLVLVSPYLNYDAPSTRSPETSARWANADKPRIITLAILRGVGLHCCEALPVVAFAVAAGSEKFVTAHYSYRLMANFAAPPNINVAFHTLKIPTTIIAGGQDELMDSAKYADIVRGIEPKIDVKIVPGLSHMDMLHMPAAIDAMLAALKE